MDSEELKAAMKRLDVGIVDLAYLLGIEERTAKYWLKGTRAVPEPAARFLAFLCIHGFTAEDVLASLQIAPRKAA